MDDHPLLRSGVAAFIDEQHDLTTCGEAGSPGEALDMIASVLPDVALVDLNLPGKGGLELIKDIQVLHPDLPLVVLTMHTEPHYAERALLAGARGYITKGDEGAKLLAAVRQVLDGRIFVSEPIAANILEHFAGRTKAGSDSAVHQLSDRELQIFTFIGQAQSSRGIASRLNISIKTVEAHRANMKRKLHVQTAPELARAAVRWVESERQGPLR